MNVSKIIYILLALIIVSSCESEWEKKDKDEIAKINSYLASNSGFEKDSTGIYIKYFKDSDNPATKPVLNQPIIFSFTGYYLPDNGTGVGRVFETSDLDLAQSSGTYDNSIVYGPAKWYVGTTIPGFTYGLLNLTPDDSAMFLIPSSLSLHDYTPRLYSVTLHEVIESDSIWDKAKLQSFLANKDFDSLRPNLYYKSITEGSGETYEYSKDTAVLLLTARYAETKGEYSNEDLGRVFFPINNYSDTVRFTKGDKNYPFIAAMDTIFARDTNRIGDVFEIAAGSEYAFDSKGIYNLQYGIPIISPYTPVHYSLEIIEVVKPE